MAASLPYRFMPVFSPLLSSFHLHPLSPRGGPRAVRPRQAGPRALMEIRIVKEQCRLSLRERCGFRGVKGNVSTVIYVWPGLIFKSDVVSPCHEPRCRPRKCLPRPHQRQVTSSPGMGLILAWSMSPPLQRPGAGGRDVWPLRASATPVRLPRPRHAQLLFVRFERPAGPSRHM